MPWNPEFYNRDMNKKTKEVIKINDGQYEIVQISSIGGACWIASRIDDYAPPQYFTNYQELTKFCGGMEI